MIKKPRLLFLAYSFPPIDTIGCIRAYAMAKWLTRKGWEVTVVTPNESAWGREDDAAGLHEDLSRQGIRCIRTEHRWRLLLPLVSERRKYGLAWAAGGVSRRIATFFGVEREAGWIDDASSACAALMPEDVDVILTSGPPFASFGLAKELSDRLGRPYVLDYRDLWTGNPYARRSRGERAIDAERILVASSASVIGVSPSLVQSLQEQFGLRKAPHVVSNGFDPEELEQIPRYDFGHFAIVYTGTFYPPKSAIDPLMAALARVDRLDGHKGHWAFHYYGYQEDYVRGVAKEFGVLHRVIIHGRVPRRDALAAVRGANIAVVISSVYEHSSLQDKGVVTGKVFEAIGLGTPLLVIAPEGSDLEGILAVTGCGKRFAGTEVDRIAGFIQDVLSGGTPVHFSSEPFSWTNIIDQLDGVLRTAVGARG